MNNWIIKHFGPVTSRQRRMVANCPDLNKLDPTCLAIYNYYGLRSYRWWCKKLELYCQSINHPQPRSQMPFHVLATGVGTGKYLEEVYRQRQQFLDWIKQNYD